MFLAMTLFGAISLTAGGCIGAYSKDLDLAVFASFVVVGVVFCAVGVLGVMGSTILSMFSRPKK